MKTTAIPTPSGVRQSNFELLRILCMLLIICEHLCNFHSKAIPLDATLLGIIKNLCVCTVNCFIILSGFFSIKFKPERVLHLILQTFIYTVTIYGITLGLGWHTLSPQHDILYLFPVFSNIYWFISVYIILYFLSPYLNKICLHLSKHQFRAVLTIGFLLFYVWPTLAFLVNAAQIVSDAGYGVINFTYLYLLGRYFKLHAQFTHRASYYFAGYVGISLLLFGIQKGISTLLGFSFGSLHSYNTVFVFFAAIALFVFFSKISLQSSLINTLAKSCIAVFLIHCGPHIWYGFCGNVLQFQDYHGISMLPILFLAPLGIYLACHFIEQVRSLLFSGLEKVIIQKVNQLKPVQQLMQHYQSLS